MTPHRWNPIYNARPDGTQIGWLFRAYRYGPDYAGLAGRDLSDGSLTDLSRLYGLEGRASR